MANVNWKVLSLLVAALLVALALQAGAIKIMINLSRQPEAAAAGVAEGRAAPDKTATAKATAKAAAAHPAPHPPPAAAEPAGDEPAPPEKEPKAATALVVDPPHLAESPAKSAQPAPPRGESGAEAHQAQAVEARQPARPSAEAALVAAETKPPPAVAEPPAHPPASSAPAAEAGAAPEAATESELQELGWLKARNPKHYTVQLYSGKDIGTLKEIAAATASAEPQAYYATGSRSGPWYSLVAGDYPDAAAAQAAAAKLSDRSPALKPWVRRFEEIQARMR